MAVTDADALADLQWRIIEDVNFSSTVWTAVEVYALFNQRQNRFNRDTFLMLAHEPIPAVAGTTVYTLPDDWIATQRVSWTNATGGYGQGGMSSMHRADRYGQGLLSPGSLRPIGYDDQAPGVRLIEIGPAPLTNGTLNVLYASLLEVLNFNPLAPDIFDVPDDFVPYILYGVMEDLFSKEGRARNLPLAAYCRERYDEGVALAGLFLAGFV